MTNDHPDPSRAAGLERLAAFLPHAGLAYARNRNHDLPGHPHVSGLSPYLRHRMITEAEVLQAVRGAHGTAAAAKFIDEVYWRSYWKGWLELRPAVWTAYRRSLGAALDQIKTQAGLRRAWEDACNGQTGIDGFDDWARQLVTTGYLHNHARMWFASIWVFTLRLPWELGADFFLRHLLDGDPASNTLSWRWVAGLHTPGKTYLARADNIAQFTGGRFRPTGLATQAPAPALQPHPAPGHSPASGSPDLRARTGMLITEEDLSPGWMLAGLPAPAATAILQTTARRSPLEISSALETWVSRALSEAADRTTDGCEKLPGPDEIVSWAKRCDLAQVVLSYPPTGPTQDALRGIRQRLADEQIAFVPLIRPEDAAAWPRATHGFFKFREAIPSLLAAL